MKTSQDHTTKAEQEEATARSTEAGFWPRDRRNAWTRAATAWTAAAFSVDQNSDSAGRFALRALRATRNAERVARGASPL
jgi:hypothetical protein